MKFYSTEPSDRIFVKGYGFYSFAKKCPKILITIKVKP